MKISVTCKPSKNGCVCYFTIVWWLIGVHLWHEGAGNKVRTTSSTAPMA